MIRQSAAEYQVLYESTTWQSKSLSVTIMYKDRLWLDRHVACSPCGPTVIAAVAGHAAPLLANSSLPGNHIRAVLRVPVQLALDRPKTYRHFRTEVIDSCEIDICSRHRFSRRRVYSFVVAT